MALEIKTIKESIKYKDLSFNDNYYTLKSEYISSTNGISYLAYKAFQDLNDVKSNNFSNLFLSKKQKNSEILEIKNLEKTDYPDFVTTLSFFTGKKPQPDTPDIWLAVDKSFDTLDTNINVSSIKLVNQISDTYVNYLFRVECLDDMNCRISHTFGDSTYYLSYDKNFKAVKKYNSKTCNFVYHIFENTLRLYRVDSDNLLLHHVVCKKIDDIWYLTLEKSSDNTTEIESVVEDLYSTIFINEADEVLQSFINGSWVTYDRSNAIDAINDDKSVFDLETQFLIHHEYSDPDNKVNFIPLKNNFSYQGVSVNGNNLVQSSNGKIIETPLVDFRNYTTINSGYNQERGAENITLTFNFTDQLYHLNPGDDCIFALNSSKEGISSIYPYKKLNINDTAFVKNGAFGSNVPYFADKFQKLQNHNNSINNNTYLCTWLYQAEEDSKPVWLDRYYYPDKVSRSEALKSDMDNKEIFALSFENALDKFYLTEALDNEEISSNYTMFEKQELKKFNDELSKRGYIDKKSDLVISDGSIYKYSRLSYDMVDEVFNSCAENRIEYVKNQNSDQVELKDKIKFDNGEWRKIDVKQFGSSHSINFNTNIFISPQKKMGIQLFGCDYKYGFNIQNRKDLTPFTYYATEECVYLMNNKFHICNEFNIKEKYNEKITYLVTGKVFEDIFIFSNNSLFILDFDLRIKNKINLKSIIDESSKDFRENVLEELSSKHIITHNKNFYAIINNGDDILKIILNPENDTDKKALNGEKFGSRILSRNEYLINFNLTKRDSLIQTAHTIKSIFMFEDVLYAFNYDILKLTHDKDSVYGIIKDTANSEDKWYYIFNQSLGKLYVDEAASKFAEFTSDVSIDSIAFGPDGYFGLLRGFENGARKCLEIYNRSKTKIYNYPLDNYDKMISLDYYRYIDHNLEERDSFFALLASENIVTIVEYQIYNERIIVHETNINKLPVSTFRGIVDSNYIIDKINDNKLYFNLILNEQNTITHEWDIREAQEGWYNINVEIDTDAAIFNIKINDILVGSYNNSTHSYFKPNDNNNGFIFDETYYFGTIGKRYGALLNEILNENHQVDPYVFANTKVENTVLYNRRLSYYEYQASRLKLSKINPLTLTLPCGVRNGIEEIIRYFKFNKPGSISNKVKINISGLNDEFKVEKELYVLKNSIIDALANADYLMDVEDIEFI